MGTWFIGAKTSGQVYEAMDVMKLDPVEADTYGMDAVVSFLKERGRWDDAICAAKPIERIFLDGGGMIRQGEPKVAWFSNDCGFKTFVRHLPFVLEAMEGRKLHKELQGCIVFGGFCRKYIISNKTRLSSIETMRQLAKGTESLRQEGEIELQKVLANVNDDGGNPRALSLRKCGCMSDKMYTECCGKYVVA
jgi:hypothetical protein